MNPQDVVTAVSGDVAMLTAEVLKRSRTRFKRYFPDCSPDCRDWKSLKREDHAGLCRRLYAKHVSFMDAGAHHRERLFMAANQCFTPWTPIQMGRATRQSVEVIGAGGFDVPSWDGATRCAKPTAGVFLRGIAPAYRVFLSSGDYWDCTAEHQVLTVAGWISLDRLIQHANGQRYSRTLPGSPASCAQDGRLDGAPPRVAQGSDQRPPRPRGDAQTRSQSSLREDGAARTPTCTQTYPPSSRWSNWDDPDTLVDLCARWTDPTLALDARWPLETRRALSRSARAASQQRGDRSASARPPSMRGSWGSEDLDACRTSRASRSSDPALERTHASHGRRAATLGVLRSGAQNEILCPSDHLQLIGYQDIIAVVPLGWQPILDMTVAQTHCYRTAGVVHHNCGKTETAAYEITCHLTGIYPSWWAGRRFEKAGEWWIAGDTMLSTRNILQVAMLGPIDGVDSRQWDGMLPGHLVQDITRKSGGVSLCVDTVWVKHVSGKNSTAQFLSYDQGRKVFQGTGKAGIWLDEEPPEGEDIYSECLTRTINTNGIVLCTFTPLRGLTPFIQQYLETSVLVDGDTSKPASEVFWPAQS